MSLRLTVLIVAGGALLSGCGDASTTADVPGVTVVSASSATFTASAGTASTATSTDPASTSTATTAAPADSSAAPVRTVLTDQVFYTEGRYIAYASPWCAALTTKLVIGRDLIDTISLVPSTFPNDVIINTSAPLVDPNTYGCGVYGYHHVAYGNYDSGVPQTAVTPLQVKNLTTLSVDVDLSSQPTTGEYNILNEFYLTSTAGDAAAKVIEIGYFLHASVSASAFAATGTLIGTHIDPSGRSWTVRKVKTFVMVLPTDGQDVPSATLDMKSLLSYLVAQQVITGDEWINGVAIGVEPVRGNGSTTINRWGVTLN